MVLVRQKDRIVGPLQEGSSAGPLDLAVVMPVYNEADCIAAVVSDWLKTLRELDLRFKLYVLNDGSKDSTWQMLQQFRDEPEVELINKPNSGHGPTILMGYRRASEEALWVFQVDSDNEMSPSSFQRFWKAREQYDFIAGTRDGREQAAGRKFISFCSRAVIRILFAGGVTDVNVPYRLMRSEVLKPIVVRVPDDTFAPNVIISGAVAARRARVANFAVPHEGRKTGTVSIVKWKLWRCAAKAAIQTLTFRFRTDLKRV